MNIKNILTVLVAIAIGAGIYFASAHDDNSGALVTKNAKALERALRDICDRPPGDYRKQCRLFFEHHVSVNKKQSSAARIAGELQNILAS